MSSGLWKYLCETYFSTRQIVNTRFNKKNFIQIDDQDDNDTISTFCNIFINYKNYNTFEIELIGNIPITKEMADLAEIYNGNADTYNRRIHFILKPQQIEVISHLTTLIKQTTALGDSVDNTHWFIISARTISSLNRFIRVVKEYSQHKQMLFIV